jgi:hypothetical protein
VESDKTSRDGTGRDGTRRGSPADTTAQSRNLQCGALGWTTARDSDMRRGEEMVSDVALIKGGWMGRWRTMQAHHHHLVPSQYNAVETKR